MQLKFQQDKCIGCHLCELACSAAREGAFNPRRARIRISSLYQKSGLVIKASLCDRCLACREACTEGAIQVINGFLQADSSLCTGCGSCVAACPSGLIYLGSDELPSLCDLCRGNPQCVAWCPHGALTMEEVQ